MLPKPKTLDGIGIIQILLALSFVVWLLFFPERGADFAWPVTPTLTAMFIGASFLVRTFIGFHLWLQKEWRQLRWQVWGNLGFLAVIFVATFWHIDEMNWSTSIIIAHIWVIAYGVEPLILFMVEPRGSAAEAPWPTEKRQGPIHRYLKRLSATIFVVLIILAALFFINPEFANTRWPWPLDPFNARIMAAFMVLPALFALKVYFVEDWAEAKLAVQGIILQGAALSVVWAFTVSQMQEINRGVYGITIIVFTILFMLAYYDHEWTESRPENTEQLNGEE